MTTTRYDQIAEWYDERVRTDSLIHHLVVPALFELIGEIKGQHICDLACGQGIIARQLAQRGATVVGVDVSRRLLEIAQHNESTHRLGIVYLHDDVQTLRSVEDETFDGATCNLALMDIADIQAAFRTVRRALKFGGWFVCSITHSCFLPPNSRWVEKEDGTVKREVGDYFRETFWHSDNLHGVRGKVGAYHRTLSTYINTLLAAGLTLERIVEPQATGNVAASVSPGYREVSAVLMIRCRKV